ncbi:MFS transporter [Brevibacillus migulae]|uniref:MFS transporter n=1 Tax=Brevibacillus migulae TaxID=1644114 RepID=UPI00106E9095|nr:MFS transporter [Brevibacillus migulae]
MKTRIILYVLGLCAAIVSLAQNLYVPLLPQLQHDLHTSFYLVSMTVSAFTLALAVMQIVFGPIIDQKGRKAVLVPGMTLYALASIGCSFSSSIYVLLFFRVLQGIGAAAVPLVAATMIGDLFDGKERAKGMATYQMILGIAPALGPLIGGIIGSIAGYSGAFGFLSVMAVVMLMIAAFVLPETKPTFTQEKRFTLQSFVLIFNNKIGALVLLIGFILYDMFYTFIVFLPDFLTHSYQLNAQQIGSIFLGLMSFSFIGSKFSGKLQGRLGSAKSLIASCTLAFLSLVLFILLAKVSLAGLLASLAVVGFTAGITMSVPPTLLAEEFVRERATAIGVYNFVRYLGMAAAPLLGSLLYQAGGILLLFGCTALIMGLAILFTKKQLETWVAANGSPSSKQQ